MYVGNERHHYAIAHSMYILDPGYEQPVSELSLPPHPSPAVRQPFNLSAMTSSTPSQRTSLNPLSNSPHISPLHAGLVVFEIIISM